MTEPVTAPVKLRDLPASYARWIHPAYRPLILKSKKAFKIKRTVCGKIKRRALYRTTIPRVPPYYCKHCTLSTRSFSIVRYHECSHRNESKHVVSYENEVRIAQLGSKSKAKDCLAVMERIPNPQHVNLTYSIKDGNKIPMHTCLNNPPKLQELCRDCLLPNREIIKLPPPCKSFTVEEEKNRLPLGDLYRCRHCDVYFKSYSDYDGHLLECCTPERLPDYYVVYNDGEEPCTDIPVHKRTKPKRPGKPVSEIKCYGCNESGWKTRSQFYEHVLGCRKNVNNHPYKPHRAMAYNETFGMWM